MPHPSAVAAAADRIEAELRRLGWWSAAPLLPEQYAFHQAFAMDTMAFSQWLQFVFLPRVRDAVASGEFPPGSMVAAQAMREFDGQEEAGPLISRLSAFDALFG
jgi:uncharacterized protein YqcC (DUF446 family)